MSSVKGAAPRALITGVTGVIGSTLAPMLLERGYELVALVRDDRKASRLAPGISAIIGDIGDDAALEQAVEECDVVFHLAAKTRLYNPRPSETAEFERVNVEATRKLIEASSRAGVRRFVYFSSVAVYGGLEKDEAVDEGSETAPELIYGRTKLEGERVALAAAAAESGGPLAVSLRIADVYGPKIEGNYAQLVSGLRRGWFIPFGDGNNRRTLVYVDDVCQAAILAAEHPGAAGRVFNVTDGSLHTVRELVAAICEALGRGAPQIWLPVALPRLALAMIELPFAISGKRAPVGRWMVDRFVSDAAFAGDKIQRELGFRPRVDLRTGWRRALAARSR